MPERRRAQTRGQTIMSAKLLAGVEKPRMDGATSFHV
jgi:hypothetical protein